VSGNATTANVTFWPAEVTEDQIKKNLLFATDKVGDTMKASLDPRQAKDWFGATPPDLSVIARSRAEVGKGSGADYLYTLWRTFYATTSRPAGTTSLSRHRHAACALAAAGRRRARSSRSRTARPTKTSIASPASSRSRPALDERQYDGPWATWSRTCNGWRRRRNARRRRRRARLPRPAHRDHLALNAAYWRTVPNLPPPREAARPSGEAGDAPASPSFSHP
jgi:hypothetical protein